MITTDPAYAGALGISPKMRASQLPAILLLSGGFDPAAAGVMVGHFMKYVSKVDNAPATNPCDPNDPQACELVLVQ